MEHSPSWEPNSMLSYSRKSLPFMELKAQYCLHNNPSPIPILNHMNLIYTLQPYFIMIHFKIVLPFIPMFSEWSPPFSFPKQNDVHISHLLMCATCTAHPPRFYHPNNIWQSVQITELLIKKYSPPFCHFIPFSNTLNLCSSFTWE
jgi:hypothetical protein